MTAEDLIHAGGLVVLCIIIIFVSFLVYIYRLGVRARKRDRKKLGLPPLGYKPVVARKAKVESRSPAPSWMWPVGIVAIVLGALGFAASYATEAAKAPAADAFMVGLVSGLLNPLFFIGAPLGVILLIGSNRGHKNASIPSTAEGTPKLGHCPDCGGHVSRLAQSCPHCGRPLAASNDK